MEYIITLTSTEDAALGFVAESQLNWIQNAVHERCRIAIDEIVSLTVKHCIDSNIQIPTTKEEIVALGFSLGVVESGADRLAKTSLSPTQP